MQSPTDIDWLIVGPTPWPAERARHARVKGRGRPDDLDVFAPMGNGKRVRWMPDFYQPHVFHPFKDAPVFHGEGGCVYLDRLVTEADFHTLLRLFDVRGTTDYAAFLTRSDEPIKSRYLLQLRLVSGFALDHYYRFAKGQAERWRQQPLTIAAAMWRFVEQARERPRRELRGCLGGDGDWEDERLGFGLLVENGYYGVYRIWTRPWLVTK